MVSKYDIVIVVRGEEETPYIYKARSGDTVMRIIDSLDEDKVFGVFDDEVKVKFFKPNEVVSIQFNLVESWGR